MPKSETTFPIQILRPPDEQSGPVRPTRGGIRRVPGNVKSVLDVTSYLSLAVTPYRTRVRAGAAWWAWWLFCRAAPCGPRRCPAFSAVNISRHSLRYPATTPTACRVIYN